MDNAELTAQVEVGNSQQRLGGAAHIGDSKQNKVDRAARLSQRLERGLSRAHLYSA